jgi:hypothetical protein
VGEGFLVETISERLARSSQQQSNGCIIWLGAKASGYGQFFWRGKVISAHRAAWQAENQSEIAKGMMICHRCDNRACINPDHLFVGTAAQNSRDMVEKERQAKGESVGNAKLNRDSVLEIRNASGTISGIARQFGISRRNVRFIRQRKTWRHVA